MPEKPVGKVEHYYPKAKAAAVGLTDDLKVGDDIHIVGHGDDVRAKVKSLQLDHAPIQEGHAGQHIGVGLSKKVHEGDDVLLVSGGSPAPPRTAARKAPARRAAAKPRKAAAKGKAKAPARRKAASKAGRRAKPKRAAGRRAKPKRKAAARRKPARKGKAARRKAARRRR